MPTDKQKQASKERSQRYRDKKRDESMTRDGQGVMFKPECVTCDELVDGGNDRAVCDIGGCTDLSASDLYDMIGRYPEDTWRFSSEYKELMRRLRSMSIDELESGGYYIPCWKYVA